MAKNQRHFHLAFFGVTLLAISGATAWGQRPSNDSPRVPNRGQSDRQADRGAVRGASGGNAAMLRLPIIAALDTDHDGVLSPDEIENAVASLKRLDKNKDGKIDYREMTLPDLQGEGQEKAMVDRLMRRDKNGDGFLSSDEMPGPLSRIIERDDKNDDGKLSLEEVTQSVKALIAKRSVNRGADNTTNQRPDRTTEGGNR